MKRPTLNFLIRILLPIRHPTLRPYRLLSSLICLLLLCGVAQTRELTMTLSNPSSYFSGRALDIAQAIRDGDSHRLKPLLQGVDLNQFGRKNMTFLFYALQEKQYDAIRLLVQAGADPTQPVPDFGSPLGWAMKLPDARLLAAMLDGGLSPNALSDDEPLIFFNTTEGSLEHLKLLVERGADINAVDSLNGTPLYEALTAMQLDQAEYLIQRGARHDTATRNGITIPFTVDTLIAGQQSGSPAWKKLNEIKKLLIERGARFPGLTPAEVKARMAKPASR